MKSRILVFLLIMHLVGSTYLGTDSGWLGDEWRGETVTIFWLKVCIFSSILFSPCRPLCFYLNPLTNMSQALRNAMPKKFATLSSPASLLKCILARFSSDLSRISTFAYTVGCSILHSLAKKLVVAVGAIVAVEECTIRLHNRGAVPQCIVNTRYSGVIMASFSAWIADGGSQRM